MDYYSVFLLTRFGIGCAFFMYASLNYYDTKCVENKCWLYMTISGVALFVIQLIFFSDMTHYLSLTLQFLSTIGVMVVIGLLGFYSGGLGGALSKGLMAMSLFAPEWQIFYSVNFPSAVIIASIYFFLMFIKFGFSVIVNIYHKETKFPLFLYAEKMDIERAKKEGDVLPLEEISQGRLVSVSYTEALRKVDDKVGRQLTFDRLKNIGVKRVWVLQEIGGIAPMLGCFCAYYSMVYGIKILGIPW